MNNLTMLFRNRTLLLSSDFDVMFKTVLYEKRKVILNVYTKNETDTSLQNIKHICQRLGFVIRKESIAFNVGFKIDCIDFAFMIINTFKKYFEPLWIEYGNDKYAKAEKNIDLKYNIIIKKNGLIIVDNYSTDKYNVIIENCFNDIFKNGSEQDIEKLNSIIEEMKTKKT